MLVQSGHRRLPVMYDEHGMPLSHQVHPQLVCAGHIIVGHKNAGWFDFVGIGRDSLQLNVICPYPGVSTRLSRQEIKQMSGGLTRMLQLDSYLSHLRIGGGRDFHFLTHAVHRGQHVADVVSGPLLNVRKVFG